jgi:hypothetical protein
VKRNLWNRREGKNKAIIYLTDYQTKILTKGVYSNKTKRTEVYYNVSLSELIDLKKYLSEISLPKLNLDPKQLKKGKLVQSDSVKSWKKYVRTTQGRFSLGYDIGQLPNYTINGS